MIYTTMTKKALKICFNAHKEQVDKTGLPYVFHPFHLAEQMDDEDSVCLALLHDVVEDTNVSFEDLINEGFNENIINGIMKIGYTHEDATNFFYQSWIFAYGIAVQIVTGYLKWNKEDIVNILNLQFEALKKYYRKDK